MCCWADVAAAASDGSPSGDDGGARASPSLSRAVADRRTTNTNNAGCQRRRIPKSAMSTRGEQEISARGTRVTVLCRDVVNGRYNRKDDT